MFRMALHEKGVRPLPIGAQFDDCPHWVGGQTPFLCKAVSQQLRAGTDTIPGGRSQLLTMISTGRLRAGFRRWATPS